MSPPSVAVVVVPQATSYAGAAASTSSIYPSALWPGSLLKAEIFCSFILMICAARRRSGGVGFLSGGDVVRVQDGGAVPVEADGANFDCSVSKSFLRL